MNSIIILATIGNLMLVNLPGSVVRGFIVVAAAALVVIATIYKIKTIRAFLYPSFESFLKR